MTALVRYAFATLIHSQRYLPPALVYLAVVVVTTRADNGPLPPLYAVCSAALLVCAAWLTIALLSTTDPVQRAITVASAGSSARVLAADVVVAVSSALLLGVFGVVLPIVLGFHTVARADIVLAVLAHAACALTGVAVGLPCSRLVIRRVGHSLLAVLLVLGLLLLVRGLPPANALFLLMADAAHASPVVGPAALLLVVSAALLAGSAVATQAAHVRRE